MPAAVPVPCWPLLQWAATMISSSRCHFQVVSMFLFVPVHSKPELFQATSDRDSESNIMAPGDRPSHGDGDAAGPAVRLGHD